MRSKTLPVVEQLIRPTGLLDPKMQVTDQGASRRGISESSVVARGNRVKYYLNQRMSEDLTTFRSS